MTLTEEQAQWLYDKLNQLVEGEEFVFITVMPDPENPPKGELHVLTNATPERSAQIVEWTLNSPETV